MGLMCNTCSSLKLQELAKSISKASKVQVGGISYEYAQKLERFMNTIAFQAINNTNRREFIILLKENNLEKLSLFVNKYVADFPQKLHQFLVGEMKG